MLLLSAQCLLHLRGEPCLVKHTCRAVKPQTHQTALHQLLWSVCDVDTRCGVRTTCVGHNADPAGHADMC